MATTQTTVELYNYAAFQGGESDFMAFRTKLPVGSAAPDIAATLLESGQPVQLSDYWRNGDVGVEFGSRT